MSIVNNYLMPIIFFRLRLIILGKTDAVVQSNTNTIQENTEEVYIVGQVLRKTGVILEVIPNENSETDSCSTISELDENQASTSMTPQVLNTTATEQDGFKYLAGWIARKFKKSYPNLGRYTYETQDKSFHTYSLPSWCQFLSFGGLTEPTPQFLEDCLQLEKMFNKYFGKKINTTKRISAKLFKKMSEKVQLDDVIIKAFIRQRIYIRINYTNLLNKEKKTALKRTAPSDEQQRKHNKKIKKFVS